MGCLIGGGLIGIIGWALGGLIAMALLVQLWPIILVVGIVIFLLSLAGDETKDK